MMAVRVSFSQYQPPDAATSEEDGEATAEDPPEQGADTAAAPLTGRMVSRTRRQTRLSL